MLERKEKHTQTRMQGRTWPSCVTCARTHTKRQKTILTFIFGIGRVGLQIECRVIVVGIDHQQASIAR